MRRDTRKQLYALGGKSRFCAKTVAWLISHMPSGDEDVSSKRLDELVEQYVPEGKKRDGQYIRRLKEDILFSRINYNIWYSEYFRFGFERLNDLGRSEFLGEYKRREIVEYYRAKSDGYLCLLNKYRTYEKFRPYYRREVIEVRSEGDREAFLEFTDRHASFILKPESGYQGMGIEKQHVHDRSEAERLFAGLIESGNAYVAEECIVQSEAMARFHPPSVNTVRLSTFFTDVGVIPLFALLRVGGGGGFTDHINERSAAIDVETGIVKTTLWTSKDLSQLLFHPDTGTQIIGAQIPRWSELLELADRLARMIPEQKWIGWDFALTDEGWVLVEGNDDPATAGIQMREQRGLIPQIAPLIKEVSL